MSSRTVVFPTVPGRQPQVVRVAEGGLSARGRALAWVLALVLLVVGGGALSATGLAPIFGERVADATRAGGGLGGGAGSGGAPVGTATAGTESTGAGSAGSDGVAPAAGGAVGDGAIAAEWDGPTVHVDWTGDRYTTVEADFVGDRVASPGDTVQRTLTLRNDGPVGAVLSVGLLLDQDLPADSPSPDLGRAIDLFWDVAGITGRDSFRTLHDAGHPTIAEVRVEQGGTVPVTVGFTMPAEETGQRGGAASTVQFRVVAQMQGDTDVQPEVPGPEPDEAGPVGGGGLAVTGAQLLGAVLVALGLLLVGWLLVRRRRRPACDRCGERVDPAAGWTTHHTEHGARRVECARCGERAPLDHRQPVALSR